MPTELSKNEQIALQIASSLCAGRFQDRIPNNKDDYTLVIDSVINVYSATLESLEKRSERNQST